MKLRPLLFFMVILLSVIVGCYEMNKDDKGRTVKINKITGAVSVIDGDKIVKLKDENDIRAEAEELRVPKTWRVIPLYLSKVGDTKAYLITKWSDGNIYYQFLIDKNIRDKGYYYSTFNIQFLDSAEFLIEEIHLSLSSLTDMLGEDDKTIKFMEHKGQKPMSNDKYKQITDWNVTWSGFDKK
jgi:hypothetical protein